MINVISVTTTIIQRMKFIEIAFQVNYIAQESHAHTNIRTHYTVAIMSRIYQPHHR